MYIEPPDLQKNEKSANTQGKQLLQPAFRDAMRLLST